MLNWQNGNERCKDNEVSQKGDGAVSQEVGLSHSSEEVPVKGMERRAWVILVTDR